jgi:hypothetical protein
LGAPVLWTPKLKIIKAGCKWKSINYYHKVWTAQISPLVTRSTRELDKTFSMLAVFSQKKTIASKYGASRTFCFRRLCAPAQIENYQQLQVKKLPVKGELR